MNSQDIKTIPTLTGEIIQLIPLSPSHFEALTKLADNQRIWEHYVYDGSSAKIFLKMLEQGLEDREKGLQFPFVIFHLLEKRLIGSTRFMDIQASHKKLEIGHTWLIPDYWGTAVNLECKLLLLTYSFEILGAFRVQLKTDENNIRSRKAIEKIGGKLEGILRRDMLRQNGTQRDSAIYSLIADEWPGAKENLSALIQRYKHT